MKLSQQRAESVTTYLISKGIDAGRFTTKWYGEAQPKGDNETKEGKAQNRRVELAIVASEELKEEAQDATQKLFIEIHTVKIPVLYRDFYFI